MHDRTSPYIQYLENAYTWLIMRIFVISLITYVLIALSAKWGAERVVGGLGGGEWFWLAPCFIFWLWAFAKCKHDRKKLREIRNIDNAITNNILRRP